MLHIARASNHMGGLLGRGNGLESLSIFDFSHYYSSME